MKSILKYFGIFALVFIIIMTILYLNNDIGVYKENIEKEARVSQEIPDDWEVCKAETDDIVAMLFYDESVEKHTFSIYVNEKGISFGYFFKYGGGRAEIADDIGVLSIEGIDENIYISMNKQQVSNIEIDDGNNVKIIKVDDKKPFTIILPVNLGKVTIYDVNGKVVKNKI